MTATRTRPGIAHQPILGWFATDVWHSRLKANAIPGVEVPKMVLRHQEQYHWQFVYLGANQEVD